MKRWTVFLLCIFLVLSGCSKKNPATPESLAGDFSVDRSVIGLLNENAEILSKYIAAADNGLIAMFGYGDLMKDIKTASEEALDTTEQCIPLAEVCTDTELLRAYYDELNEIHLSLQDENDRMKKAKKERDFDALESSLLELLSVVKEYNPLLAQFEKELK